MENYETYKFQTNSSKLSEQTSHALVGNLSDIIADIMPNHNSNFKPEEIRIINQIYVKPTMDLCGKAEIGELPNCYKIQYKASSLLNVEFSENGHGIMASILFFEHGPLIVKGIEEKLGWQRVS